MRRIIAAVVSLCLALILAACSVSDKKQGGSVAHSTDRSADGGIVVNSDVTEAETAGDVYHSAEESSNGQEAAVTAQSAETRRQEINSALNDTTAVGTKPATDLKPTQSPTQKPTQISTDKPTQAPTQKPTSAPTAAVGQPVTEHGSLPKLPPSESESYLANVENEILSLMNSARREKGLAELKSDDRLKNVARYKSSHMLRYGYFAHETPDGKITFDWLNSLNIRYTAAGENIAYTTVGSAAQAKETARSIFTLWQNSPGHNANMMSADFNSVGIGVVFDEKAGLVMATQVFAKI